MHVEFRKDVEKIFQKIAKKNPKQLERIINKIEEIKLNPHHYKNLRKPLQQYKRVRIESYVLVFSVKKDALIIEAFEHHNHVYE